MNVGFKLERVDVVDHIGLLSSWVIVDMIEIFLSRKNT